MEEEPTEEKATNKRESITNEEQGGVPPLVLTLTSSSSSSSSCTPSSSYADDDDLFEPVSLRDLTNPDNNGNNNNNPNPPPFRSPKFPLPQTAPEVLYLVDSAIMNLPNTLPRLQQLISNAPSQDIPSSVVDALLSTMGAVDGFHDMGLEPTPTIMQNSRAALVSAELIPYLPSQGDSRKRMVRGLLGILQSCTLNRAMCSSSGLLRVLLDAAEKVFVKNTGERVQWDCSHLCHCIQVLAGHSLSVVDLHHWLGMIKRSLMRDWAVPLTLALEKAVSAKEAKGPANSFELDGEKSGLICAGETKWPFVTGWGFATWIYMESFADTISVGPEGNTIMPRLFSYLFTFLGSDGYGIEVYFHGHFLVVETGGGKVKKKSIHFSYLFKPRTWYFVGLDHVHKQVLLGKEESELSLYVDGNLHESRPFELPRVSKPLAYCCIGTNPPPKMEGLQRRRRQCPLFGDVGPVYIFKEHIGQERMVRLANRGGDALPSFGSGAGLPWKAVSEHVRNLAEESYKLDTEIGGSLYLLFHPILFNGRVCPDASPSGASGLHQRFAEAIGKVHVASRLRPTESIWALAYGGPMALLPLTVSNVQMDNLEPVIADFPLSLSTASLSASIFRIISTSIQHPGNNEELCRVRAPELLSKILHYHLLTLSTLGLGKQNGLSDEELVAAIVSLCQCQKDNHKLKVQLFSTLLLDLRMWSMCNYSLQKKLLSSLADMVFTESPAMRDANALQMLLDGCRQCYWVIRETDSVNELSIHGPPRQLGEVNALVDELLVTVELLMVAAPPSLANEDVRCLISFLIDSPQPNQVGRVLHLIYRLVVQPNTSRGHTFALSFISCGGIETILLLLQREAKTGNRNILDGSSFCASVNDVPKEDQPEAMEKKEDQLEVASQAESMNYDNSSRISSFTDIERMTTTSETQILKNLGGISFNINSENARNNVFNIDNGDGVVVGIINLLGALINSRHIKFGSDAASQRPPSNIWSAMLHEEGSTMFGDKVSLLLFSLQKAFQAAPQRLMTTNVYMALLATAINVSSADEGLNIYDSGHRFEDVHLLLILLRSLPYASTAFQARAIQDLLFLACSHPENRTSLTCMAEWPEWIVEVLISNYEMGSSKDFSGVSIEEIEDLIHNFLIIMLEHSMRQKDGWKDVEASIHCAEWLSMIGGSSTGDQRVRREEALPIFKRRLLGGLLDFSSRELEVQQTEVIAAAAAGVAAEGLSPDEAKVEAENATKLIVALAENAIVILMLVEDHLRLQAQLSCSTSKSADGHASPASTASTTISRSDSLSRTGSETFDTFGSKRTSTSTDTGGLSMDVLASMADANGQVSAAVMERLTAAAAAEPYESVRCAFVSYGTCALDLSKGWNYRSRLWYGVGLPLKTTFGGGGSGWEPWKSVPEKDSNGNWIELPLMKKSIAMLQALLLDECVIGAGLNPGGGSGTGTGGMKVVYQMLDSDQPFLCMLRMVLASMREDDNGEDELFMRNISIKDNISEGLSFKGAFDNNSRCYSMRKPRSALLWSVLAPILNMPVSESKRQRVLVASSIMYSEVWHAFGMNGKPLRKNYVENILPPFIAILRRWRPLLAGIHELKSPHADNPLTVDDPALAADSLPLEAALSIISPGWAAAFASPPAAMALAMIAAGTSGGEIVTPPRTNQLRRDTSLLERRTARVRTFASFQKPPETSGRAPPVPKDKAAAKAAALAAARDLERNAKIGSGRGLSAVAMATSGQRRSVTDSDRAKRWTTSEAMSAAWTECLQSFDSKSVSGRDFSSMCYKYIYVLVTSFAMARNMQRVEMDRRTQVDGLNRYRMSIGTHAWQKLLHCLIEMSGLFGPLVDRLCNPQNFFWKLDFTISSSRMRRYFKRKFKGSDRLEAAIDSTEGSRILAKDSETSFTINFPCSVSIARVEDWEDEKILTNDIDQNMLDQQMLSASGETLESRNSGASSDQNLVHSTLGVAPAFVPIDDDDERIILELPSLMVRPLKVVRGNFQITTKRINFVVEENINDNMVAAAHKNEQDKNRSWSISSLHQMFSRRYLLRRSALEFYMVDRSAFFFDFENVEGRKNAYRAIIHARPPHLGKIYMETQRPEQLLKRTQLMERWARWEISNFEYLMELNILAGRSYNDITQYPVFPWILADYCSKTLNLGNSSSYRDLSKPIGAVNADRLKKFQERYSSFEDPVIPKFHYRSHYSSVGTALYYLVRVEPFTTLSIQLQGTKFDQADHVFSDINTTWNSVLEDMSDVKELIPEMFYLPEVLANEHLGTTQLRRKLGPVKLPPWANNPVDFIRKHRMALESEHVSAHLHKWIDLIFGYKQRGEEAVSASNVFFFIAYEGAVDVEKLSDAVQRRAMQDQTVYCGQTPSQLLTVPHLHRKPIADVLHLQTIFRNPSAIKPYAVPSPECFNVPAASISALTDSIIVVDDSVPSGNVAMHKWQPNSPGDQGNPFQFNHLKSSSASNSGGLLRILKGPSSTSEEWHCSRSSAYSVPAIRSSAVITITSDKEIITGGHADNSIKIISATGAKTVETATTHCAPVTCLALSEDSNYLVSGSRDTTVILWRIHRSPSHLNNIPETSSRSSTPTTPNSPQVGSNRFSNSLESMHRCRIEGPMHVLRGNLKEVVCCCVSSDLGLIASSSNTSGILLHSLRRGRLIRKLDVGEVHGICLSSQGVILLWNELEKKLSTFTVNGMPIATNLLSNFSGSISCIDISADGENVVFGTCSRDNSSSEEVGLSVSNEAGKNRMMIPAPSVCFLNLHALKVFHTLDLGRGQDVTALALTKDNTNLLVTTADKQLIVFTDPALSLKLEDQTQRQGNSDK